MSRRPRLPRPPKWKWTDVAPVPPILLVIVASFITWTLKGKGSLIPTNLEQLKVIGIFFAIVLVSYALARFGYMYMQKAATLNLRKIWGCVMCTGLLALLGTLAIQFIRPEFGLPSLTAWVPWIALIALFEGKNQRTSMFFAKALQKLEDITGAELDGYDNHQEDSLLEENSEEDTLDLGGFYEPPVENDPPARPSVFATPTATRREQGLRWSAGE